ncbi:MAG: hydroxymethylbilane synthase [Deltaproteobacteria bacterium]|nr:hydroxymethylbilane synthase [Deltaproteobacteria bacterium]
MPDKGKITIGTRGSALALWQANWVKNELEREYSGIEVNLTVIKTKGDKILDVPLAKVGGKGLFVKEIEDALLAGEIDLAVHSMKDVPTELPENLQVAIIPPREDPRDAFFSHSGKSLREMPSGAVIGTSSLRRKSQLLHAFPQLTTRDLRGNVDTRLKKLARGEYDGIILAYAGVKRLGWADQVTELIDPLISLPAIAQGALGIETRINDDFNNQRLAFFHDIRSALAVRAERAFLKTLEGGCQVPIAAHATVDEDQLINLTGLVAALDGHQIIKESAAGSDPEKLGRELACTLLQRGADVLLQECFAANPES